MASNKRIHKTALVLAGGGLTGALYEIGALRAIDDLLIDRTVNDFDIYVGTSSGAMVSTFLANGVSPELMLRAIEGTDPNVDPLEPRHVFSINYREITQWGLSLPLKLVNTWTSYLRNYSRQTIFDLFWTLSDTLPAGLYDGLSLERYVRQTLDRMDKCNQFADLPRNLFVVATDLDDGEREVFGPGYDEDTPVSLAVAASAALPLLYKPIRIKGRDYVDGGLRGNASIDIAIEQGATLIVCINPLVPFVKGDPKSIKTSKQETAHSKHIQSIASQMLRISTHAGLQYHIKQLRRAHPQVDIILIEPRSKDYQLFSTNIMRYSEMLNVASRGFESATVDLADDYPYYKQVMGRHRIPITRRLVNNEISEIRKSGYDPQVIRHILEARKGPCGRRKFDSPICQLTRVLSELELTLEYEYARTMGSG